MIKGGVIRHARLFAAGCVLCVSRLSHAETGKVSKAQAQYQAQPQGDQKCANCMHFIAPMSAWWSRAASAPRVGAGFGLRSSVEYPDCLNVSADPRLQVKSVTAVDRASKV
jgi:hypothetical protein